MRKIIKNTIERGLWIFIILGMVLGYSPPSMANPKIKDLKQKAADMALLRHQLDDRIEQAKVIREKFRHQKQSMIDEISLLRRGHKINRFVDADQDLRIHYNLKLIGSMEAYLNQIEYKITVFETGQDKLIYLQKMASDDIKMIDALNDLEIDALTTQISLVINQYLAEAHVIQLNRADIQPTPPQKVWHSIVKSN